MIPATLSQETQDKLYTVKENVAPPVAPPEAPTDDTPPMS